MEAQILLFMKTLSVLANPISYVFAINEWAFCPKDCCGFVNRPLKIHGTDWSAQLIEKTSSGLKEKLASL